MEFSSELKELIGNKQYLIFQSDKVKGINPRIEYSIDISPDWKRYYVLGEVFGKIVYMIYRSGYEIGLNYWKNIPNESFEELKNDLIFDFCKVSYSYDLLFIGSSLEIAKLKLMI